MLIRNAFGVLDSQIVSGQTLVTPDYLAAEKFDIEGGPQLLAASEADCPPSAGRESGPASGARVFGPGPEGGRTAGPDRGGGPAAQASVPCGAIQFGPGRYRAHAVPIDQLVNSLSNQSVLTGIDRAVS